MKIAASYSYKGGTGKTTSIVNIAYNLYAIHKKRVLLIDMDPQCNLTWIYGKVNRLVNNIYSLFSGQKSIKSCIRKTRFGIDMIYGSPKLEELDITDPEILKRALASIEGHYDYVLIDCHPAFDWKSVNALVAAHDLFVTLKLDQFGLNGLELIKDRVSKCKNPQYHNLVNVKILVTMAANRKSQIKILNKLFADEPYPHFETAISYSEAANSAMESRKPLLKHRSKEQITEDYLMVTQEYLDDGKRLSAQYNSGA